MKTKTSRELVQVSNALKNQIYLVRLITNDLYINLLISDIKKENDSNLKVDLNSYYFDINAIILELMGFKSKQINNELGYWYCNRIEKAIKYKKIRNIQWFTNEAIDIYFEMKSLKKIPLKKLKTEILRKIEEK